MSLLSVITETFPWSPPIKMAVASNSPVSSKAVFSRPTPLQKLRSEIFCATGLPLQESTLILISEHGNVAVDSRSLYNGDSTIHLSDMDCRPPEFRSRQFSKCLTLKAFTSLRRRELVSLCCPQSQEWLKICWDQLRIIASPRHFDKCE